MFNRVILIGRLCADPEVKQTASGVTVCRFRIAVNRPYKKDAEKQEADFINISCFKQTAEFVGRWFSKGKPILVEGCLRNNDYTDSNGVKHYSMEVLANQVGFVGGKDADRPQESATPSASAVFPPKSGSGSAASQPNPNDAVSLADYEEILSDGEVPF